MLTRMLGIVAARRRSKLLRAISTGIVHHGAAAFSLALHTITLAPWLSVQRCDGAVLRTVQMRAE